MRRLLFGLAILALVASWLALRPRTARRGPSRPSRSSPTQPPSYEDIAQRAYFIGLDHEAHGDNADPQRDWAEAEHELLT